MCTRRLDGRAMAGPGLDLMTLEYHFEVLS